MCTAIALHQCVPGVPLLLGFNRDQLLTRTSLPPLVKYERLSTLAPTDIRSGGTWLGLNEAGLLVAIVDHFRPRRLGGHSRGQLVSAILGSCHDPQSAAEVLSQEPFRQYAASTFLIANKDLGLIVSWHDVMKVEKVEPGLTVIVESGVNRKRVARCQYHRRNLSHKEYPLSEAVRRMGSALSEHDSCKLLSSTTCCHSKRSGTLCSQIVALGSTLESNKFFYADGPPCRTSYEEYEIPFLRQETGGILSS